MTTKATIVNAFEVRNEIGRALKRASSVQDGPDRSYALNITQTRQMAEKLIELGYIDVNAVEESLKQEEGDA